MPSKRPPKETNQLAKYILEVTTGETEKIEAPVKNIHAVNLARLGASKGGNARAAKLSKKRIRQIAKKGAQARWAKNKPQ